MRIGTMLGRVVPALVVCWGAGCMPIWRASLPELEGEVAVAGLDVEVEILRDGWGVPHIRSDTDRGAVFGLGWCHAQDRLWQLELNRRIGAGRLSEMFGKRSLKADRYLRTMGFRARAEEAAAQLDPQWQWLLDAYFEGVNAYLATDPPLPPELKLLGVTPEPFEVADGFTWIKIMALGLGADAGEEELRTVLAGDVAPDVVEQLLGPFPDEVYREAWMTDPVPGSGDGSSDGVAPDGAAGPAGRGARGLAGAPAFLQALFPVTQHLGEAGRGSNNWVVSGEHTTTGAPLLANDPHLDFQMPALWYLAHLEGDRLHVTGPTFPGLPGFAIGHNEHLAWGLTNVGPDVQDLVLERFHPDDPGRVEVAGGYEPVTVREEVIRVKGGKDVVLSVRETRHGPIVTEFYAGVGEEVALRWTALAGDDATVVAFSELALAANVEEGMRALRHYVAPAQNVVLADTDGHIGWVAAGRYPLRSGGDDGNLPVPGWDGEHEWQGWLPFEQWPRSQDPERGWIATANARTLDPDYPHFLGDDFSAPYRTRRIVERLTAELPISADGMAGIQDDVVSGFAVELLPALRGAVSGRPALEDLLEGWDGGMRADSAAAALFQAWLIHLPMAVVADELGEHAEQMSGGLFSAMLHRCFVASDCTLCDDVTTAGETESCDDAAGEALDRALAMLEARLGDDPSRWRWGELHETAFRHSLGSVPGLRRLLDRTVNVGGSPFTVAAAFYDPATPFETTFGVSYRQVTDLADWDRSRYVITTGQSGHPASPHYDDMVSRWAGRQLIPMAFSEAAVDAVVRERMVLVPGS